jgi:hypothetical protein
MEQSVTVLEAYSFGQLYYMEVGHYILLNISEKADFTSIII